MSGIPASTIKRRWRMSQSRLFSHTASPLCFATRNCRSLASKIKLEQLGLEFKSYNVDFMTLQETRRNILVQAIKVLHSDGMLYTRNGGMGFAQWGNGLCSEQNVTTLPSDIARH